MQQPPQRQQGLGRLLLIIPVDQVELLVLRVQGHQPALLAQPAALVLLLLPLVLHGSQVQTLCIRCLQAVQELHLQVLMRQRQGQRLQRSSTARRLLLLLLWLGRHMTGE